MTKLFTYVALGALLASILVTPFATHAAVFSSNDVVEVNQPVRDDAFLAGERIIISETIQDDVFVAGGSIEIKNTIGEDIMAIGNTIRVSSDIGDDAFLAGDHVVLTNSAVGDLFAAGRIVELQPGTAVRGDAYLAGSRVIVHGLISGTVRVASEAVEIAPDTVIRGNLIVYSARSPQIADGATIGGTVSHITTPDRPERGARSYIASWVRSVLTWFIVSLLLLFLLPKLTAQVVSRVPVKMLNSFLVGLLWCVLALPATILLFVTIVGWPLALIVLFLSLLLAILSVSFLPIVIGAWVHRRWVKATTETPLQWQHALLGVVIVVSVQYIPLLGPLATFVVVVAIAGTLLRMLRQHA